MFSQLKSTRRMLPWIILLAGGIVLSLYLSNRDFQITIPKIVIFIIFCYTVATGVQEEKIINPVLLFSLVPLSLLLYNDNISKTYLVKLSTKTYWFAIMHMISFLIAYKVTKKYSIKNDSFINKDNYHIHAWILLMLSFVGRMIPVLSSLSRLLVFPAISCAIKSKKWGTIIPIIAIYIFSNINDLQKTMVLGLIIVTVVCVINYNNINFRVSFKSVTILIFSFWLMVEMFTVKSYLDAGGTFWTYFANRTVYSTNWTTYYLSRSDVNWGLNRVFFLPYMYMSTPWTNLQYVMETQANYTYGLWLLKPVLGWIGLDESLSQFYQLTPYSSFNTYTYMAVQFKDFGYFFSIFESMFLGVFTKKMYLKYINSGSPLDVAVYAMTAQATCEMFFSNHFFMQSYPFTILLLILIYRLVFGRIRLKFNARF